MAMSAIAEGLRKLTAYVEEDIEAGRDPKMTLEEIDVAWGELKDGPGDAKRALRRQSGRMGPGAQTRLGIGGT